jgi:hypothetical protein
VESKLPHLVAIDSFRGLAIVIIIAGHVIGLAGLGPDAFSEKVAVNLFRGGTALFVFISGFLFHYLLPRGFSHRRYLLQKAEFVLLPYLIMSAIPVTYAAVREAQRMRSDGALPLARVFEHCHFFIGWAVECLSTGALLNGYWYVPFILTMFLFAPAFLRYTQLPFTPRLTIMGAATLTAMFVHRPVDNLSVLQSVVYFTPLYLLGINVSIDRKNVLGRLAGKEWLLGIGILGLSFAQVAYCQQYGNMHKPAFEWGGADLNLIQKMLGCLFFYSLFSHVERLNRPVLKTLAAASFALFFLHPVVIATFEECAVQDRLRSICGPLPGVFLWVLWTLVVTMLSYGIAVAIRWFVPGQSRRIIGW